MWYYNNTIKIINSCCELFDIMELEILEKVGLSKGEIKIYKALLNLGNSSINKIHERTGIERRNIYDILNKLIEKGLVSYTNENKKRTFQVTDPKRIISYIQEKKDNLENIERGIIKEIPLLIKKIQTSKPKINAEVYRGFDGVKAVWEDMLNYKETYWIGSGRYVPKNLPTFFKSWNRRRVKLKVCWWDLFRNEFRNKIKLYRYEKIKFLPAEFSGNPTVIAIYGNKVVNFIFGKEVFAFVIESEELAENYKKYHKYLWDNVAR